MTCKQCALELDAMDNQSLGSVLAGHLSQCPQCSKRFEELRNALMLYRMPLALCAKDIAPRIAAMLPFMQKPRRVMALRNWLAVGLILMISLAFTPFLEAFEMLDTVYGNGFLVPLGIVTGLTVTLYAIIFIATHVEDFSRRFRIRRHA